MIFNPVIVGAIVAQAFISKASRMAGAVTGYIITTGIMAWGLSLYSDGSQIALFGIPLSQPIFITACLVWYGFDTKEFFAAKKAMNQNNEQSPTTLQNAVAQTEVAGACPHCGVRYKPDNYSAVNSEWLCSVCGKSSDPREIR